MTTAAKVIEVTAGEIAEALKRQGIGSDERVTLTIQPGEDLMPGRRDVEAAQLSQLPTQTGRIQIHTLLLFWLATSSESQSPAD